jgi:D-serine deaminase-like pyridoxal phosphate-dependent protein
VPSCHYERQLTPGLVAQTPTPALFVFMDAVRDNVATMLRHCGGEPARWRPHLKTTKMAPVYEALLEAGVRKFKCATLKEATVLLELVTEKGTDGVDLLVAYPHVEPTLSLLSTLANTNSSAQLSVLIEDAEGAAAVHDNLGIFIDVNVGTQYRLHASCPLV